MSSADWKARAARRVDDILSAIDEIEGFTLGMPEAAFLADRRTVLAVTHLIQIIGEAAKHPAEGIEARQPGIPWTLVRSMRDRIVHEYGKTDPRLVWLAAIQDLAPLRAAIEAEREWLASLA